MTRLLGFASFLTFAWTLSVYADEQPEGVPSDARWVKVDRVTDGDTIVLMDRTRVRLHGIDTPERDQPYGPIATAALEYMVARGVYLVEVDEDRYGRLVGQLYHSKDGYDINASIMCGICVVVRTICTDSKVLSDCQVEAQQAPKGLWKTTIRSALGMASEIINVTQ